MQVSGGAHGRRGAGGSDLQADRSLLPALADWFMSLGVGLLTFASLETVGIYFGLGKAPRTDPRRAGAGRAADAR